MHTTNDTSAETVTIPLTVTLTVVAVRDPSGGYAIAVPALPGCVSEADDADDIAKNVREAADGWLAAMHRKHLPQVLADFSQANRHEADQRGGVAVTFDPIVVPLQMEPEGRIRVIGTRVPLDTIIGAYDDGATPEGIVDSYSTVSIADVYAIIAYYLRHQAEVREYLKRREIEADRIRREFEAEFPPTPGLRERLMSRMHQDSSRATPKEMN